MSPKKDSSKAATKAAPKPIKKEPTMVDDTRKQTSNMLTQLKNGQHKDEEKKALLQYYQNLDRFSLFKRKSFYSSGQKTGLANGLQVGTRQSARQKRPMCRAEWAMAPGTCSM